ncbi:MAG: c-type cytochrome, partial [Pseudomonadota bacterium]
MKGTVTLARLPPADHPVLALGGEIWDEHCRSCHGSGLAGAPKVTGTRYWSPRIAQGLDVLFAHAKEGFS